MASLLGCDVYCEGMKGIGAGRLSNLINVDFPEFFETHQPNTNEPITLYGFLHRHLVRNTPGFDTSVVQTYIRALVYEPTNVLPEAEEEQPNSAPVDIEENPAELYRSYLGGLPLRELRGQR